MRTGHQSLITVMVSRSGGMRVGVVGVAVELGEVGAQPPGPSPPAQLAVKVVE